LVPLTVPVGVYVGGVSAKVAAYALSGSPGLAQIAFIVPSGVTGCNVPVAVQTGMVVSNFVTMAVAATGRTCSDPVTTSGSSPITIPPAVISKILAQGYAAIGTIDVIRSALSVLSTSYITDLGSGGFLKTPVTASTIPTTIPTTPPVTSTSSGISVTTIGACSVIGESIPITTTPAPTPNPTPNPNPTPTPTPTPTYTYLDAGTLVITGPNGTRMIPRMSSGLYSATLGQQPTSPNQAAMPIFLDPGNYTFGNGSGGADVGPFTFNFTLPPALVWTNSSSISIVQRAVGQPITWTGGDPASTTSISGASFVITSSAYVLGEFSCIAPTSDQHFTIPSFVLLTLPATPPAAAITTALASFSFLGITAGNTTITFTAPGLDFGIFTALISDSARSKTVTYQ
jgi:hypothetical protein